MASHASAVSAKRRRPAKPAVAIASPQRLTLSPVSAATLPLLFAMLVVATTAIPGFVDVPAARWSCWGAAGALALWALIVASISTRRQRTLQLEFSLRPQHYVQA